MPQEKTEKKVVDPNVWAREWRARSKEKIRVITKRYREKHKERLEKKRILYLKINPWIVSLKHLKSRCTNVNDVKYHRYGGRGIKALIDNSEMEEIWLRDKAYSMTRPSIDRIDNDGNYTRDNCRFIELSENVKKGSKKLYVTKRS